MANWRAVVNSPGPRGFSAVSFRNEITTTGAPPGNTITLVVAVSYPSLLAVTEYCPSGTEAKENSPELPDRTDGRNWLPELESSRWTSCTPASVTESRTFPVTGCPVTPMDWEKSLGEKKSANARAAIREDFTSPRFPPILAPAAGQAFEWASQVTRAKIGMRGRLGSFRQRIPSFRIKSTERLWHNKVSRWSQAAHRSVRP